MSPTGPCPWRYIDVGDVAPELVEMALLGLEDRLDDLILGRLRLQLLRFLDQEGDRREHLGGVGGPEGRKITEVHALSHADFSSKSIYRF